MIKESIHILDKDKDKSHLEEVFKKIAEGNTILFLGAGASVTNEKKYLSQQIIEYYEDKVGKSYDIKDISQLLDILESTPGFRRNDFDNHVSQLLKNLKVGDFHKLLASIRWLQIITTNYDLLVEQAYDDVRNKADYSQDLYSVRAHKEYFSTIDSNAVKYIKLNGCLSDKSKYPFVLSTKDFSSVKKYHKSVLQNLRNPSDKVLFISIGYSYSDNFSYQLLDEFDSIGRERRVIYNIDPFVNENLLPFFEKKNISIIKLTGLEFLSSYKKWQEENRSIVVKSLPQISLKTLAGTIIRLTQNINIGLGYGLKQINEENAGNFISKEKFYLGEEPNFKVITNSFDVIRKKLQQKTVEDIENFLTTSSSYTIPLCLLTGTFGTGKTTFTYRLIKYLMDKGYLAFEIFDIDNIKKEALTELIEKVEDSKIIFYTNYIDNDSFFKSILTLRTHLSTFQFQNDIIFLSSIRENCLEIYKRSRDIKSLIEINIDSKMEDCEIEDLIDRLKSVNLTLFRDLEEKKHLIQKIKVDYDGDQFITLLNLISNGKHHQDMIDAYSNLSPDCQKAFQYTALLHKYNLMMPVSLLRRLIAKDWDAFKRDIIDVEGKGILIQEHVNSKELDPDLYFKTKHPIIASKLLEQECNIDKQYKLYKDIFKQLDSGNKSVRFVNNLLKAISDDKIFNSEKINQLFDIAFSNLSDEPYFVLNHAMNLQIRGGLKHLTTAYDNLIYAGSLLEYQAHRFFHRRGSIKFDLAKLYHNDKNLSTSKFHLKDAIDLLRVKRVYDPCSSFSYVDLIQCLMWQLDNYDLEDDEILKIKIEIEELLETGRIVVIDRLSKIIDLDNLYIKQYQQNGNKNKYYEKLELLYDNFELRPYACILLYNYCLKENNISSAEHYLHEMELYLDNSEVVRFLFKIYGQNLHNSNTRIKFFDLVRKNYYLENENSLRFYYYMYVAESYNYNIYEGFNYLKKIKSNFSLLNPEYERLWLEANTDKARLFEGVIVRKDKHLVFKTKDMQIKTRIIKSNNISNLEEGQRCKAHLVFTLTGIKSKIF